MLSEDGLGVAEVLLASSLVLVAVLGASRATIAAVAAQGRAGARERAALATDDVLEVLRAAGCLQLTGAETPTDAATVAARCHRALSQPATAPVGGGVGHVDAGGGPLEVRFGSRWVGATAPADPVPCASGYYGGRPVGVEHRVSIVYREAGRTRARPETRAMEVAATDRYTLGSWQRSNLVVESAPGASADLTGPGGVAVRRLADPSGCIWFPALRTATYVIRAELPSGAVTTTTVSFVAQPRRTDAFVVHP